jgi:hypothetical protein
MATDPAPAPRRLWQLPTFLIGFGALVAMWYFGDRIRPSVPERYEKAMIALRPAVDRWPPDPDQVRAALRKIPDADPPADMAPRVKYLTGSAYVALAEALPDSDSAELWTRARRDLEAAADFDLPLPDQKKLRYRLARAWFHTNADPNRTIEYLTKFVGSGDDPSEGHRLLANLHRTSNPPDESAERDDLQNFLKHATPRADARTLNGCRVRLAELHAKLGEPEKAKAVLERVGPDAPPDLYANALLMLAGFARTETRWQVAAQQLEKVLDMKGATDDQKAEAKERLVEARIALGLEDKTDLGPSDSPEARAAWFRRADKALTDPLAAKDAAVVNLERAYAGTLPDAKRKLIPDRESRRVFQAAFQKAMADGDFALAVRAATIYAKVIPADDHNRLTADAQEIWAKSTIADAVRGDEARDHYRAAAEACVTGGHADQDAIARADWLRRAAGLYLKAGDRPKALKTLTESAGLMTEYPEDRAGQAWSEVGEIFRAAGDQEQARIAFQNAAGKPGPMQDRASIERVKFEINSDLQKAGPNAIKALQEVLARKPAASPAVVEEALYLLGEIHLMRKEWPDAETHLKNALDSFPQSQRAARGHFHYGQVLRHNAYDAARKIKTDRATIEQIKSERLTARLPALKVDEEIKLLNRLELNQKTYDAAMRGAYDEFRKAEEMFVASPDAADPTAIKRTSFWAADCAFWNGEYADSAARYEKLMTRYRGRIEEMEAGRDLHRCCSYAAQSARDTKDDGGAASWSKRAAEVRVQVSDALTRLPASELDGSAETRKRGYWESWLVENSRENRR